MTQFDLVMTQVAIVQSGLGSRVINQERQRSDSLAVSGDAGIQSPWIVLSVKSVGVGKDYVFQFDLVIIQVAIVLR